MSNWTQEQLDFAALCDRYDWPDDLMAAWLYSNSAHGTPFPKAYWTKEMVEEIAEGVERLYSIACQKHALEKQREQMVANRKESLTGAATQAAVGIGLTALSIFLGSRR